MKTIVKTKQFFTTLNMTYYMQAGTVLAFAGVVAFLITQNDNPPGDNNTWVSIVSLGLISSLATAYFIFRLLLKKIDPSLPLQQKMPRYARALLVRSFLIELPGLLAGVSAYVAGNLHFLAISVLIVIIFVMLRPTRNTIANDLNLSPKERALLDNDEAVISEVN